MPDSSGTLLAGSGVSAYVHSMKGDEQVIRDLIAAWQRATAEGNLSRLLTLMSNDVVFLTAVQPPMSKDAFAAAFQAMLTHVRIESNSEIKEIRAFGDWAYLLESPLGQRYTAQGGQARRPRRVHPLNFQPDGAWKLARDANMLAVETSASD